MTTPTFRSGAATHVGLIRTMNEDSFIVGEGLFAVADGMGGHLAGEVASQMAIHALDRLASAAGATSLDGVVAAVADANDAILQMSQDDPTRRGMGTTLTALALVRADGHPAGQLDGAALELAVVNLGDSRTYRLRDGVLEQVTVDHSYVQELVSAGHLTPDEARYHPQRNIVTRALGIEPGIGIDVWNLPVVRGDRYLLCSDGLVDEVTDERIAEALQTLEDPQAAAEHLVDMANRAGGRDNVTVVIVDVVDAPPRAEPEVTAPSAHADTDTDDDTDDDVDDDDADDDAITAELAIVGADTPAGGIEALASANSLPTPTMQTFVGATAPPAADDSTAPLTAGAVSTPALTTIPAPADATTAPVADPAAVDTSTTGDVAEGESALPAPGGGPVADHTVTIATTPPPAEPASTTRRTRLGMIALLGGLAVLAGIVFTVLRDDEDPTPTTVTVTPTVTTAPVTNPTTQPTTPPAPGG